MGVAHVKKDSLVVYTVQAISEAELLRLEDLREKVNAALESADSA